MGFVMPGMSRIVSALLELSFGSGNAIPNKWELDVGISDWGGHDEGRGVAAREGAGPRGR